MTGAVDLQRVFVALLRSANLLVIAAVSAFLVASVLADRSADAYETRALVDVQRLLGDEDAFSNSERADRTVANELVVAQEPAIAELAAARVDGATPEQLQESTSIEQLTGTDNLAFVARADAAPVAGDRATAYATAYAASRLDQRRAALLGQADGVDREVAVLSERLRALRPSSSAQVVSETQALQAQYEALIARGLELRADARALPAPEQLVLPAPVPDAPAGPGPVVWGAVAALLALCVVGGALAVRSRLHDPVGSRQDLEALGLRVLAEAPAAPNPWRRSPDAGGTLVRAAAGLQLQAPPPRRVAVLAADQSDSGRLADALHACVVEQRGSTTCVPATTGTAEGLRVVRSADLALVVVRRGSTRRQAVAQVLEQLEAVNGPAPLVLLLDARTPEPGPERPPPAPTSGAGTERAGSTRRRVHLSSAKPRRPGEASPRLETTPADGTGQE